MWEREHRHLSDTVNRPKCVGVEAGVGVAVPVVLALKMTEPSGLNLSLATVRPAVRISRAIHWTCEAWERGWEWE
jgi:hypothetical protein